MRTSVRPYGRTPIRSASCASPSDSIAWPSTNAGNTTPWRCRSARSKMHVAPAETEPVQGRGTDGLRISRLLAHSRRTCYHRLVAGGASGRCRDDAARTNRTSTHPITVSNGRRVPAEGGASRRCRAAGRAGRPPSAVVAAAARARSVGVVRSRGARTNERVVAAARVGLRFLRLPSDLTFLLPAEPSPPTKKKRNGRHRPARCETPGAFQLGRGAAR